MKNQDDFFNSDPQKKYYIPKLTGFKISQINFCHLLNILSVDIVIKIYLHLICGKVIAFFSDDIKKLSIILHIFHQLLFPFSPNENVSCLSPIKYFCNDLYNEYMVGFLCNYDDLEFYNPFGEKQEEKENYFKCDYVVDLDKEVFKPSDKCISIKNIGHSDNDKKLDKFIEKIITKSNKEFGNDQNIISFGGNLIVDLINVFALISKKINTQKFSEFELMILKLYINLGYNSIKLENNQYINIFYSPFINKEIEGLSKSIKESFYKFNLDLAFWYYNNISLYNGDYNLSKEQQINSKLKTQNETNLNDDEYLFLNNFGNSIFSICLDKFVGGYSDRELMINKSSKLIFVPNLKLSSFTCSGNL